MSLRQTEDNLEKLATFEVSILSSFFFHQFLPLRKNSRYTKDSVIEVISAVFFFIPLFFMMIADFSRSQSRLPTFSSFPLSLCVSSRAQTHTYRHGCTQTCAETGTLKRSRGKWRCADCPLRLLHYLFFCVYFPFSALIFCLSFALSLGLCSHSLCQVCVRLFPILIVPSLVILSPVPHLSAIIKDPVASYVAPVERRVCISATHLATAPRNYGL